MRRLTQAGWMALCVALPGAARSFSEPDEASVRDVEAHRRELGIMPLADYVCMMSEARKPRP